MWGVVVIRAILGIDDTGGRSLGLVAEQQPIADTFVFGDAGRASGTIFFGNKKTVAIDALIFTVFGRTNIRPYQLIVGCFFANCVKRNPCLFSAFGIIIKHTLAIEIAFVCAGFVAVKAVIRCLGANFGAAVSDFDGCMVFDANCL